MKLHHLSVLAALIRTRSATLAAQSLNISQPAVSKALKQIESDLKLQLFARTNGRLIPTPEAEALYPEVTKALRGFKAFRTVADAVRDGQIGGLSVGAIPTFSNSLLPEAVARFGRRHPSLRISIYAISARELIDSVQSAHVDFGMLNSTSDPGICDTEDLSSSEIVCIMPRGHPLAALPVIQPRDLQQCCLIGYESRFPFFDVIARAFKKARIPYTPRIEVGSSILLSSLVNCGGGVGLIEPFVLMTGRFPNTVVRRFKPHLPIAPRLLYPPARPLSAVGKELVKELKRVSQAVESGSRLIEMLNSRNEQPSRPALAAVLAQ